MNTDDGLTASVKDPEKIPEALARLREAQPNYIAEQGNGDERFALWLWLVDRRMMRAVGVTHSDIGDWTWRDAFDDGMRAGEAAREALENDDTYSLLF